MFDLSLGYEVLLLPALYALVGVAVLGRLVRGFHKEEVTEGDTTIRVARYDRSVVRRAMAYLLVGALVLPAVVVVPFGHRAVVWSALSGVNPTERAVGVSFIVPYVHTAVLVDVRTRKFAMEEVLAQSADLQEITVPVAVEYRVVSTRAAELVDEVGREYEDIIIRPAVLHTVKQEVGQIKAIDFALNRSQIAQAVQDELAQSLAPFHIEVQYVAIEDAVFDKEFIEAVKAKVIADEFADEQRRLVLAREHEKRQVVIQAEAEEQRRLIEARGEAEAIRAVAAALGFTPTEYLEWLRLQRWDGVLPTTLVGTGDPLGLIFDME